LGKTGNEKDTETAIHDRVQGTGRQTDHGRRVNRGSGEGTGIGDQTLRNWVKAAAQGKLKGAGNKVVTPEQMELSRLRAENVRLKRESGIIKKAAAYFAKDVL
jgi:transposase